MKQNPLFPESKNAKAVPTAHIDGGARGNPGPAAYGVVFRNAEGHVLAELSKYLGAQTNNYAEYSGLLAALEYGQQQGLTAMKVFSDSELLVKQIKGQYKVSSPGLRPLFDQAKKMIGHFQHFSIQHVFREQNRDADRLVNKVLDQQRG
ncbi:MAG TPA: ribonuclease HI family protein [Candidatus Saccharimonadales bacterium]|nr:ribonuclease HI family protein [Candidatus Saccharimonadales bacterium]